jgi:hypothetical protein
MYRASHIGVFFHQSPDNVTFTHHAICIDNVISTRKTRESSQMSSAEDANVDPTKRHIQRSPFPA